MRILITLSYYLPNISGVTLHARNLAKGLTDLGHKASILTSQHKKDLPKFETVNDVDIYRLPVNIQLGRGPIMFKFPFDAIRLVRQHDLISCHLPQFEAFYLVILGRLFRKRVVVSYHADLPLWPGFFNLLSFLAVHTSNIICLLLSHRIVAYTKDNAENSFLIKYFLNKVDCILPPIIIDHNDSEEIIRDDTKYKIGFVGRVSRQKGIEVLLNSIPFIKDRIGEDFKIYLVGPYKEVIGEDYISEIDDLIEKYEKYISLVGKVDPDKMASIYKNINVLVLPSTEESLGMVQMEAMLHKTPVVATNLPGVRQLISLTGMGEIIKVNDPEDLGDKITKVLQNKENYLKNHKKAEELFSFDTAISKYIESFTK